MISNRLFGSTDGVHQLFLAIGSIWAGIEGGRTLLLWLGEKKHQPDYKYLIRLFNW